MPRGIPRPLEALAAAMALVIGAPLLLLVALAVRLTSAGPVLFRQQRVGRGGAPFTLLKFRSMRIGPPGIQVTAAGDPRVTPLGRWLRLSKLDELPALWNVVRGDMSLVGPRPEVPSYVDLTDSAWVDVLRVRPGLTDPVTLELRNEEALMAQVAGDRDRFYRDVLRPYKLARYRAYLARRSARADLQVLMRTLLAVMIPAAAPPPTVQQIREAALDR